MGGVRGRAAGMRSNRKLQNSGAPSIRYRTYKRFRAFSAHVALVEPGCGASGRVVAAGGLLRSLCRDRDGAPPRSPSRNRYSFLGFLRIEATFLSDQPSINFDARPSDELECAK